MTLIKFTPLTELETWNERISSIFNDFPKAGSDFYPRVDVKDDNKNIYIEAEIPGVKKEDVKITLQDNVLTISGEKKKEADEKNEKNFYHSERYYGSFTRSFTLPEDINRDDVEAKSDNGILSIRISKSLPVKAEEKFIEVK